jgi:nitric oxide reductase NorQ protein|tara:strand:+ start:274 stop:1155 length:882 start_codon:yes stop_codon:yes gene_type:complete
MTNKTQTLYKSYIIEEYFATQKPYYVSVADEIELFEAAYKQKLPVLFKGPTGCGKTRFVEYMAYKIGQEMQSSKKDNNTQINIPLVTIACHEDLTASDLVGRYLLEGDSTVWLDGPLTRAVKAGGICYLDEVVEARKDTTVIIHPLTDHRRILPVEKKGELLEAAEGFLLVLSYNPGYQSALKDLKHSTRQRFVAIEFDYPSVEKETEIIAHESGLDEDNSNKLAILGEKIRNLKEHGLPEGASTRLLIYAAKMISQGIKPVRACQVAVNWAVTDDPLLHQGMQEVITSIFPE